MSAAREPMLKLLRHASVYAPAPLGVMDVLIAGEKICRVDSHIDGCEGLADAAVLDLEGRYLLPGYIDLHAHITGGGGEQGPSSRVPEAHLSAFLRHGVTTAVGLLGTDGVTRSLENLLAKARALTEEGMTVYTLTSAYGYPPAALTGSVERDIVLLDPMIGVKVAVSDHRGDNPTGEELIRLASGARRAGLLSGKPGLTVMHMGAGRAGLDPLFHILDHSDVPAGNLLPTHVNRSGDLAEQGMRLLQRGGQVDFTAGMEPGGTEETARQILRCLEVCGDAGERISLSSDAFGSQPRFDRQGTCIGLTYVTPETLHRTVQALVGCGLPLERAAALLTTVPARLLGRSGSKGCIAPGADADLLVLDDALTIQGVFAQGRTALWESGLLMRGRFEPVP